MTNTHTLLYVPQMVLDLIEAELQRIDHAGGTPHYQMRYLRTTDGRRQFHTGGEAVLVENGPAPSPDTRYFFFSFVGRGGRHGNALCVTQDGPTEFYNRCAMEGTVLLSWQELTRQEYEDIIHNPIPTNPQPEINDEGYPLQPTEEAHQTGEFPIQEHPEIGHCFDENGQIDLDQYVKAHQKEPDASQEDEDPTTEEGGTKVHSDEASD